MKKILFICLSLITILFTFSACHSEKMDLGLTQGSGELSLVSLKMDLDLNVDTVLLHPKSRAGVDVSKFLVSIFDKEKQLIEQYVYDEMPEIISLPVGKYTIEVASAAEASSGFDVPFYKGEIDVEVEENKITEGISVSCKLANIMINVTYEEDIRALMGEDVVTIVSLGTDSLEIPITETRTGYLVAPASESAMMEINMRGTVDGEYVSITQKVDNVKAGQLNIINYTLDPVDDGSNGNLAINIDSSMTASDETVGVNPGKEQEIEDFPAEGGGSSSGDGGNDDGDTNQNAPSIVGANFNGSPFDISNDVLKISGGETLQVKINAPNGIANLYVDIKSETLDVTEVGLVNSFDLAYPGEYSTVLSGLGFPVGDNVINQTEVLFDISYFTKLLLTFHGQHNFVIKVVDAKNLSVTQTLKTKVE